MNESLFPTAKSISKAAECIQPYLHNTPVLTCSTINKMADCQLFFKCENFQKVGAFKARGALNATLSLTADECKNGIATHSSGNHAAALSLAAKIRQIPAYIVMPSDSSKVKIEAVKEYAGLITFCSPNLKSREETLLRVIGETNAIEIHPYNNYKIIEGQATAAFELIRSNPNLNSLIAPVGGGGLLSGTALSCHYFSTHTKVYAAEPMGADDAFQSFKAHTLIPVTNPNTIADGLRTSLGTITFPIIHEYVTDIFTVTEQEIVASMKLIWERMKIIVEPSSAVTLAAVLKNKSSFKGQKVGIILSGGNVSLTQLPWQ